MLMYCTDIIVLLRGKYSITLSHAPCKNRIILKEAFKKNFRTIEFLSALAAMAYWGRKDFFPCSQTCARFRRSALSLFSLCVSLILSLCLSLTLSFSLLMVRDAGNQRERSRPKSRKEMVIEQGWWRNKLEGDEDAN